MKTVNFLFGIHNHQPVGNFDFVFEEAYQKSYKPFIDVLEQHPGISMSLHYSGCLLEWLEDHHPEYMDRIADLVDRGNIELMSGGFYEPILAVIPDEDKIGQIRKLNRYIKDRFRYDAEGLWLTERVWEPHLAKPLNEAGIKYITVDDAHFISAGKRDRELTGYFHTEEQGKILDIFPIKQQLRYLIPFEDPQASVDFMRKYATEAGDNAVVMADDGEKFGVWPGTYGTVYEEQWLDRFFTALEENSEWLKTQTFSDYYHENSAKGRVYLPTGSYFEMGEWTLPAHMGAKFERWVHHLDENGELEEYQPFIKGGIWRNFFAKYEESNWIHKRVLGQLEKYHTATDGTGKYPEIRDELWRATCNCAYWHGIFGGLYLPHLRDALYKKLLAGESELAKQQGENHRWEFTDVDRDGNDEAIGRSDTLQMFWKPSAGAALVELDYLPADFNLINTLRRYKESYHSKVTEAQSEQGASSNIHDRPVAKEADLEKYLVYDWHPRQSFLDHFLDPGVQLEQVAQNEYKDAGDFVLGKWTMEETDEGTVTFHRRGRVNGQTLVVQKTVTLEDKTLQVRYNLENTGNDPLETVFAPECNFSLLGGESDDRYFTLDGERPEAFYMNAKAENPNVRSVEIANEWDNFRLALSADRRFDLWRFPVHTVSMSESGFERVYQSSVIMPRFALQLDPGKQESIQFTLKVTPFQ